MVVAYEIASSEVQRLVGACMQNTWSVARDLPWDTPVSLMQITPGPSETLLSELPEFEAMSVADRTRLTLHERIYHLSNLLAGEHRAVALTARVMLDAPRDTADILCFGSFVLADERNHYLALHRYLTDKVGTVYGPHPRLTAILDTLTDEASFEVKLFVAQVALEWTATSLLATLMIKQDEPLLRSILRKVLADEGRHLAFNRWAMKQMQQARRDALRGTMEELFFEAILATISSFFAVPVWREFGLSLQSCRAHARRQLERREVLRYYSQVLPMQLERCGFSSDRLVRRLQSELVGRLASDQWTFEPVASQETTT